MGKVTCIVLIDVRSVEGLRRQLPAGNAVADMLSGTPVYWNRTTCLYPLRRGACYRPGLSAAVEYRAALCGPSTDTSPARVWMCMELYNLRTSSQEKTVFANYMERTGEKTD